MAVWPYPWQGNTDPLAIPAGFLRHQVTLQVQSSTPNSVGEPQAAWNDVLTRRAGIMAITVREVFQSGPAPEFVGQVTHRVTVRWPGSTVSIYAGMRATLGSRVFLIQGVDNVQEMNRVLHIYCLEINGGKPPCS